MRTSQPFNPPRYIPWQMAGGDSECKHGIAEIFPCDDCDRAILPAEIMELLDTLKHDAGQYDLAEWMQIEIAAFVRELDPGRTRV